MPSHTEEERRRKELVQYLKEKDANSWRAVLEGIAPGGKLFAPSYQTGPLGFGRSAPSYAGSHPTNLMTMPVEGGTSRPSPADPLFYGQQGQPDPGYETMEGVRKVPVEDRQPNKKEAGLSLADFIDMAKGGAGEMRQWDSGPVPIMPTMDQLLQNQKMTGYTTDPRTGKKLWSEEWGPPNMGGVAGLLASQRQQPDQTPYDSAPNLIQAAMQAYGDQQQRISKTRDQRELIEANELGGRNAPVALQQMQEEQKQGLLKQIANLPVATKSAKDAAENIMSLLINAKNIPGLPLSAVAEDIFNYMPPTHLESIRNSSDTMQRRAYLLLMQASGGKVKPVPSSRIGQQLEDNILGTP